MTSPTDPKPAERLNPAELLEAVTSTVGYLRISARRNADSALEWLSCAELMTDSDKLLAVVDSTTQGRGIGRCDRARGDIAMSLFLQAYAFRVASAAIGGWLLSGGSSMFDVRPSNTAISLGRDRPNALAMNHVKFLPDPAFDILFDQHLGPMVVTAHRAVNDRAVKNPETERVGEKLLWGNVAAGCASVFGAFHGAWQDKAAVRDAADEFFARSPDEVKAAGRFVTFHGEQSEPGWFWERNSCCLLYKVPPVDPNDEPLKCEDCSLWSVKERTARYISSTAIAANEGN